MSFYFSPCSLNLIFITHRVHVTKYQFTLPYEPYRRTCTRFYGRSRALLKTGQFFFEPTPHHDGPPFDPMPASDASPLASATASHPGDATCVTARSDSAEGWSAAPFSAL